MFNDNTSATAPYKAPPQQPEVRAPIGTELGDAQREARDLSINTYLKAALEAHRASGKPWANIDHISPLDREGKVTSGYSSARKHPVKKTVQGHPALDIAAADSGPANVVGMVAGTVIYKGWFSPDAGNAIMVLNDNGEIDFYAHLATGSFAHIHPGERIRQGQIIAEMGETGTASGPHVHITVRPLSDANKQRSAMAQAQQVPGYVAPVIIDSNTGLPMPIAPLEDPAFKWTEYENVYPLIKGRKYYASATQKVPAPSREILMAGNPLPKLGDHFPEDAVAQVPKPAGVVPMAETDVLPGESNIPAHRDGGFGKNNSVPPFKR